ncbi:MAG: 50S ribosomal protein L4 [Gammaproteobacteria bacterium RBG_16_57_12]|nr:MAG: 50S ribosomal protein L4 [Gammaproteobacteria bacterium RBG_16_57_12]
MKYNLTTATGKNSTKSIDLSDAVFAREFNEALIHQVITAHLAGARAGTHAQKTRADVSGGGCKPWKQKGSGRARAGTIRSPLWRGGGKVFAAITSDYSQKVNKKMHNSAIRSILSELVRQERLLVLDSFEISAPKTKELAQKLDKLGASKALIVTDKIDDNLYLSSRNLKNVQVCNANRIDPVNLVGVEKVLMTVEAIKQIEEMLS